MQWFPRLRAQVEAARTYGIPIVAEDFLVKSAERGKRVREGPYRLFSPKDDDMLAGPEAQSTLDPRVKDLVNLLFDESEMERALAEMQLDGRRLLDCVTSGTIADAYRALADLDAAVRCTPVPAERVRQASQRFYALIPHREQAPLNTAEAVQKKLKVLEAIRDVGVAAELMKQGRAAAVAPGGSLSPVDIKYRMLKTRMEPVEKHSQEYSLIQQYVTNTHAAAHSAFKLEVDTVLRVEREGETTRFEPFRRLPNHRLLWHGSRFTNFVGILT
jgi:poly [ADP-ribose] polymerase